MRPEISDGKITLKSYEKDDASRLCEAARESRDGEFTRWMPWCHEKYSRAESDSFIAHSIKGWENKTEFNFVVLEAKTGEFLGGIGLNQFNPQHNLVNLGYWIRRNQQNRGIASQATRLLAKTAFEDLTLNRIEILVAVENAASQKAAKKSGAEYEGILRNRLLIGGRVHDAAMFSFIPEDFTNNI